MRRRTIPTVADLSIPCKACGYAIPLAEQCRLDAERMQCPKCHAVFHGATQKSIDPLSL